MLLIQYILTIFIPFPQHFPGACTSLVIQLHVSFYQKNNNKTKNTHLSKTNWKTHAEKDCFVLANCPRHGAHPRVHQALSFNTHLRRKILGITLLLAKYMLCVFVPQFGLNLSSKLVLRNKWSDVQSIFRKTCFYKCQLIYTIIWSIV